MNHPAITERPRRILLVDDTPTIHEDFRKVLLGTDSLPQEIDDAAAAFFGEARSEQPKLNLQIDSAFQGEVAVSMVRQSLDEGAPYSMAFVDMRMPPGIDGLTTIQRIWAIDPDLEVVICTAYSDRSWREIRSTLGLTDQLVILKKPFDQIEARQLAMALSEKWIIRRLLRQRMEGLEDLVNARTAEWVRVNQSKNQFLANVSHELLTPMNGILGMAELLQSAQLNEEERGWLGDIRQSGRALLALLKNVLQFNEIHAGRFSLNHQILNVADLCGSALSVHAAPARAKGLALELQVPPNLPKGFMADPGHVKQLVGLLVENAVKFTDRGSVKLSVRTPKPSGAGSTLEFIIEDTGRGLSSEELATLQDPFAQLNAGANRRTGGIGMGLTLAKQLLKLLGGKLSIESTSGKGSTFSIQIPDAAPLAVAI